MLTIMPVNKITPINNNNINFKSVYAATPGMIQESNPDTQKLYGQSLKGLGEDESIITKIARFFSSKPSQEDINNVKEIRTTLYNTANQPGIQNKLDLIA